MALGFGFNKAKVLASAEKYVQSGKIQNAIGEYQKVLKQDPKDLTVLNTVGDLHAKLGQVADAVTCFKTVGESYAHDGFTVKAIAMFKKTTKLSPGESDCVRRLAELYTLQGLYNDARAQYMLLADAHVKAGNLDEAAKTFQKMLELDPENANVQAKLADMYMRTGKKDEAKGIFLTAAQSLYSRGAMQQADDAVSKVLSLDAANTQALQLRGQIAIDSGRAADGIGFLEQIPDLDSRPEALQALLRAKVALGQMDEAEPIAKKLLTVHNDVSGVSTYAEGLMNSGNFEAALKVYDDNADRLLSTNPSAVMQSLHGCISRIQENAPALERLLSLARRSGDTSYIGEISELAAHAFVQAGEFAKARDLYKELAAIEPENPIHIQNYKQMLAKLGEDPAVRPLSEEESSRAMMSGELDLVEPTLDQEYPKDVHERIRAAITDSELFDSYNQEAKAIEPLERGLQYAPQDVRLNYRLSVLYLRTKRHADAARTLAVLQDVLRKAGRSEEAGSFGTLAQKQREIAGLPEPSEAAAAEFTIDASSPAVAEFSFDSPAAPVVAEAPAFEMPAAPPPVEVAPPPAPQAAHEIDLSDEWEVEVAGESDAGKVEGILDEARFYLSQGMVAEARSAVDRAAKIAPNHADIPALRQQMDDLSAPPLAAPPVEEFGADGAAVSEFVFEPEAIGEPAAEAQPADVTAAAAEEFKFEEPPAAPVMEAAPIVDAPPAFDAAPPLEAAAAVEAAPVEEEFSLDIDSPVAPPPAISDFEASPLEQPAEPQIAFEPPPPAVVEPPPVEEPAVAAATTSPKEVLADFALDLADSLPEDFGAAAMPGVATATKPAPAAPVMAAAAAAPAAKPAPAAEAAPAADMKSALSDIFDEFKENVEQAAPEEEDPNTHYNLGIAFKEMALLDEAIGEFQKVCHAMEAGVSFAEPVQVYTMLANCFAEKGMHEVATKWFLKGLAVPNLDEDTKLAIHYEIGSMCEAAGDTKTALHHFMEVYGSNIDYRDVAERIKGLRA